METEAERYNFLQKRSGLNKTAFAQSLGITKAHGHILSIGKQKPSREVMERLAVLYHINLHWFLMGEGPSGLDIETVEIELLEQEAAAGRGREIEEYAEARMFQVPRSLVAPCRPDKLQAVYVAGDSMTGDNIYSGDMAIFYPGLRQGEDIYVVSVDNALLVKRVAFDEAHRTLDLISSNTAYPPRRFQGPELEAVRIAGKVIAIFHRV
jgi:SOS-response transcriptional repressor LexA